MSLDSQHPRGKPGITAYVYNPIAGEPGPEDPWGLMTTHSSLWMSSTFSERLSLKNKVECSRGWCQPLACTLSHINTHTCIQHICVKTLKQSLSQNGWPMRSSRLHAYVHLCVHTHTRVHTQIAIHSRHVQKPTHSALAIPCLRKYLGHICTGYVCFCCICLHLASAGQPDCSCGGAFTANIYKTLTGPDSRLLGASAEPLTREPISEFLFASR